jgi:hypothetical protein
MTDPKAQRALVEQWRDRAWAIRDAGCVEDLGEACRLEDCADALEATLSSPPLVPAQPEGLDDVADALLLRLEAIVGHTFDGALIPMTDAIKATLTASCASLEHDLTEARRVSVLPSDTRTTDV